MCDNDIYGIEVEPSESEFEDPIWGDATLVSTEPLEKAFVDAIENEAFYPEPDSHFVYSLPEETIRQKAPDVEDTFRSARLGPPPPHSFIAIRRTVTPGDDYTKFRDRARDIAALLGLSYLADSRRQHAAIPALQLQYSPPKYTATRLDSEGQLGDIGVVESLTMPIRSVQPRSAGPVDLAQEDLARAFDEEEPSENIPFPEWDRTTESGSLKWHLCSQRPLVAQLEGRDKSKFAQQIASTAHRLHEAVQIENPGTRIVEYASIVESLVSSSHVDWSAIRKRTKCLLACPDLPFDDCWDDVEEFFDKRNKVVHGGKYDPESLSDVAFKSRRISLHLLRRCASLPYESFHKFTETLDYWTKLVDAAGCKWDAYGEEQRAAVRKLLPFEQQSHETKSG